MIGVFCLMVAVSTRSSQDNLKVRDETTFEIGYVHVVLLEPMKTWNMEPFHHFSLFPTLTYNFNQKSLKDSCKY